MDLDQVRVIPEEGWQDGPPHELFKQMRGTCPVHWSDGIPAYPSEAGYWSVTRAEDVEAVSRDWETYSSASGITVVSDAVIPVELISAMFIGMDPPKHDRLKNLFQRGFTPKRIGEHEEKIRAITVDVLDRLDILAQHVARRDRGIVLVLKLDPGGVEALGAAQLAGRIRRSRPEPERYRDHHGKPGAADLRPLPGADRRASDQAN